MGVCKINTFHYEISVCKNVFLIEKKKQKKKNKTMTEREMRKFEYISPAKIVCHEHRAIAELG